MPRPIKLEISTATLRNNLNVVMQRLNQAVEKLNRHRPCVWAVIKANAYGHGIAQGVLAFKAADGLAMLDFDEAMQCRQLGWKKPILLLEGFFNYRDLILVEKHRLSIVIHNFEQLAHLKQYRPNQPIDAYFKINTGMNRLGFARNEIPKAWSQMQLLKEKGFINFLGSMTHFALADESVSKTKEQINIFNELNPNVAGSFSVCNSAATLNTSLQSLLPDTPQWVRPGICLYGASPFTSKEAAHFGLMPAQTLKAEVIGMQEVAPGQGIGYGHTFKAPTNLSIAVVACGYADGYPRHAPSGTPVVVNNQRAKLVGRVSMDMLTIDVTNIANVKVGSEVILWGAQGPSVDEVAQHSGTIGYELVTAVTQRVPRFIE